jgi:gamma-glutamyltranspeptidase / glutathione hydrolase
MVLAGCVAETIFTGIGGGGFATVYDAATRSVTCLDFFVAVPGLDGSTGGDARTIEVSFGGVRVPYAMGGPTVAVPGTPAGVEELHRRFGRLSWADVVEPARAMADAGVDFPAEHARLLVDISPAMLPGAGRDAYWRGDPDTGRLLGRGELLRHPGLAETLAAYQVHGAAALMTGGFADELIKGVRADGGVLSAADLAAYQVRELDPLGVPFGAGLVSVRGDDLDEFGLTLDRLDAAAVCRGGVDRAAALAAALRAPARRAETTSVAAVDADGNACAVTHSLGLGSGIWVGGVHANSMMGEGELLRGELVPGTRMRSMMVPLVVTDRDGALVAVGGAAGGSRIRPALLTVLSGILLQDLTIDEAVAAPRLVAVPGAVHLEPGFDDAVVDALRAAGDDVLVWAEPAPYFGGVAMITADGPAADPRRGGLAITV